jgi:hypothetical protein
MSVFSVSYHIPTEPGAHIIATIEENYKENECPHCFLTPCITKQNLSWLRGSAAPSWQIILKDINDIKFL